MQPLTIPGNLDSLKTIRKFIASASAKAGLDKKALYGLTLAVDEVATNIITHGFDGNGADLIIRVVAEIDETKLEIYLEDTGKGYDPGQYRHPESLDQPLLDRPEGGLGVFLALQNVDKFLYQRLEDMNRHTFTMYKHLVNSEGIEKRGSDVR
jgi:anti-sigma regulatory factor (Ser/Thr protein kinase)